MDEHGINLIRLSAESENFVAKVGVRTSGLCFLCNNECHMIIGWIKTQSKPIGSIHIFHPIGSMYAIYGNMDPINIPPL